MITEIIYGIFIALALQSVNLAKSVIRLGRKYTDKERLEKFIDELLTFVLLMGLFFIVFFTK